MKQLMGSEGYIVVYPIADIPSNASMVECIDTWTLNIARDVIETTGFGTTTAVIYKSYEGGLKSATGSATGNYDKDSTSLSTLTSVFIASEVSVVNAVLYMNSGNHVSIACIVGGFVINENVTDKVTFSFDFTCKSDPVFA